MSANVWVPLTSVSSDSVLFLWVANVVGRSLKKLGHHMMSAFTVSPGGVTPPSGRLSPFLAIDSAFAQGNPIPNDDSHHHHQGGGVCQTPLTSPAPRAPNPSSTTLYRRFLNEVTMSPATTPPRSPSPVQGRASPQRGRNKSPGKSSGKECLSKGRLQVGQNAFHFVVELPESKIVPKKTDNHTPSTRSGAAKHISYERPSVAVTKEKPRKAMSKDIAATNSSATRNEVPSKSAPALSHPTNPKATTPGSIKHAVISAGASPTKSIKMATRFAQRSSTDDPISQNKRQVKKERGATHPDSPVTTIAIAPPPSLNASRNTPTRSKLGGSFNIGELMAGLRDFNAKPRTTLIERAGEIDISEPPTPLRKAAEKLQPIVRIKELGRRHDAPVKKLPAGNNTPSTPVEAPIAMTTFDSPFKRNEEMLHYYSPLLFPPPSPAKPLLHVRAHHLSANKHVAFEHDHHVLVSSEARKSPLSQPKTNNGTDPSIRMALRNDMISLETTLSHSLGVNCRFTNAQENTFELPIMANSVQESHSGTPKISRPKAARARTTSEVSSTSDSTAASSVRTGMLIQSRGNPDKFPTPSAKALKWPYKAKTPAYTRREMMLATKDDDDSAGSGPKGNLPLTTTSENSFKRVPATVIPRKNKTRTPALLRANRAIDGTQSQPETVLPTSVSDHARHEHKTIASTTRRVPPEPSHANNPRFKSVSTPAKSAPAAGSTTPRRTQQSVLDSPSLNKAIRTPKDGFRVARDEMTQHPKFAGALDIADRVAEWHGEDRKKAVMSSPQSGQAHCSTRNKTTEKESHTPKVSPAKAAVKTRSHTPQGSPPSRPSTPSVGSPRRQVQKPRHPIIPPTAQAKSFTPRRPAPATPTMPNKALARFRGAAPRTPASRLLDPNACRTPSKEIESSLDAAIDRKIAEDARNGLAFTPGGNCVKSLLEAKKSREESVQAK
ncbi:hypothetical protein ACEQ8H_000586 [Pleosporales sp. CAS-2024a]